MTSLLDRHVDQVVYYAHYRRDAHVVPAELHKKTVAIVGVGGLGTELLLHLVAAGVGSFALVDPDIVAPTNLNRQLIFGPADIGALKVDCAARFILAQDPQATVTISRQQIVSASDLSAALAGLGPVDLVACCADYPVGTVELAVLAWCRAAGCAASFSGMQLRRGYWALVDPGAVDAAVNFFMEIERHGRGRAPLRGSASFTNSCLAALLAEDAVCRLARLKEPRAANRLVQYDFDSLALTTLLDFRSALSPSGL